MAGIERLQLRHRRVADIALSVGPAIERPVVEDGDLAVSGRRNVDLDHVRAKIGRGRQRTGRVLEVVVDWLLDPGGGAGVAADALVIVKLGDSAVGY